VDIVLSLELPNTEVELIKEMSEAFQGNYIEIESNSIDGSWLVQFLIPLAVVLSPLISQIVQKVIENERVTIKYDGVEIQAPGKRNALEIYEKLVKIKEGCQEKDTEE
jgi:hypothetical protein